MTLLHYLDRMKIVLFLLLKVIMQIWLPRMLHKPDSMHKMPPVMMMMIKGHL
jgi:hypothetical protein